MIEAHSMHWAARDIALTQHVDSRARPRDGLDLTEPWTEKRLHACWWVVCVAY